MRLLMLGINHHTASVDLRERLSMSGEMLDAMLASLRARYPHAEAIVISTCNRTEFYLARPAHEAPSFDDLLAFVAKRHGMAVDELSPAVIHREGDRATMHLFRVCCGLESMVLGEPQILGQVKRAYEQAVALNVVGPALHRIFQQAIATAKQARTTTGIDTGRVSIGSVAVDFARQIFGRFDDKVVVGIGAGEMAKLTLKNLQALQPAKLWLTNRTQEKATLLASRLGLDSDGGRKGGVRSFDALDDLLVEADIVLTSTGSRQPIITAERFKPLLKRRRHRPIFLVDIAVPRDIEPAVASLRDVYLYNIDDLQQVIEKTQAHRSGEVTRCEEMLRTAVDACMAQVQHREVGRLIRALRQRFLSIGEQENNRTASRLLSADEDKRDAILAEHTHRLINKILHLPLSQLNASKHADEAASLGFYAAALRRLFDLHELEEASPQQTPTPEVEANVDQEEQAPSP